MAVLPWDVIQHLGAAGLSAADVDDALRYLTTFQNAPRSQQAGDAIGYLAGAGLDRGGVDQTVNYLRSGQIGADVARPLAADPAYLAFQRALGADDADLTDRTLEQKDAIARELARMLPRVAQQGEDERRGISGGFEARGIFRSGEHELALARQRQAEQQRAADLQNTAGDQTMGLERELARQRAANQRRLADYTPDVATRMTLGGF